MRHLSGDARFAALISRIGRPRLNIQRQRSPYEALVRAIAHQQLPDERRKRFWRGSRRYSRGGFPEPNAVLATADAALRGCGFSGGKIAAIRDICAKTLDGTVPTRRQSHRLSDEALIERLISIRGVGRWTVEMLLLFTLGRPDVLPVDDFGVREGYRVLYELAVQPKPKLLSGLAWPGRRTGRWPLGIFTGPQRSPDGRGRSAEPSGLFQFMPPPETIPGQPSPDNLRGNQCWSKIRTSVI